MPRPGGAIGDPGNDDYVAQVLASEARDNSLKYSTQGLGAYMPKRPTGAAPKPNTRFLRNIIRDTDSHNTALKRKEEKEARDRLRQLRNQTGSSSTTPHDTRRHRHGPSGEKETGKERREGCDERRHRSHRRRHRSQSASPERSRRHRRHDADYDRHGKDRQRGRDDDYKRDYSRRHRSYSGSRSRSPRDERGHDSRRRRRHRHTSHHSRSRSPSRRYKADDDKRDDHRSSREHQSSYKRRLKEPSPPQTTRLNQQSPEDDSDPLEDLVGPLPNKRDGNDGAAPIRSRGRGAYKPNTSTIDAHFAKDYDPNLDVHLEDDDPHPGGRSTRRPVPGLMAEDNDWELALEALRDRTRWKQKGEERLRQAGFNDDTVERWKNNTAFTGAGAGAGDTAGQVEDVKWSKRGEGREWDRGKVFDEDGHVDVKAPW